jgi:ketosteroid isomerase-like protein
MIRLTMVLVGLMAAAAARTEAAVDVKALADQVRATEQAFAKSMADRNHAAFTSHLADEAVFFGGRGVSRGKAAVAASWKPLFDGPKAPFSWEPEKVEVLDSGTLAISTGAVFDPQGKRTGTFNSIWRLESGGVWKIIFDNGCPPCGG